MIQLAVVGLGIIGITQLRSAALSENFEICGVCDLNEELVRKTASEYKVPAFTDYHQIPKECKIDAVILNLPHFLHCEATVFFLEQGIHVLVEKPMANTVQECDKMLAAAEKSGKKLAVGHIQRFFAANRAVRDSVKNSTLGKLVMTEEYRTINYFADSRPRWFLKKEASGGGIVMNYGAHALDKLFYITGMRNPEIVSAYGNLKNDFDVEGHAQSMLKFRNGLSSVITFSGYAGSGYEVYYYFTEGALRVNGAGELYKSTEGQWKKIGLPEQKNPDPYVWQLDEFAKMIAGEVSEITDGFYGKDIIKAIETIYGR